MASWTRWKDWTALIVVFAVEGDRCPILHSFLVGRKAYHPLVVVFEHLPTMDHMEALLVRRPELLQGAGYLQS
jgi:hypothetical protein